VYNYITVRANCTSILIYSCQNKSSTYTFLLASQIYRFINTSQSKSKNQRFVHVLFEFVMFLAKYISSHFYFRFVVYTPISA